MEDQLAASQRAWLASIERFSQLIEKDLEEARARSKEGAEVRELEELQLKILRLWKRQIARTRGESGSIVKTRWIKRGPEEPRDSSVDSNLS